VPDRAAFVAALEAEGEAFDGFVGILEAEAAALNAGDVDALIALAQSKSEKVALLSRLSESRRAFLRSAGFSPDRLGMSEWLVAHGGNDGQRLSGLWSALLDRAVRAQQLNEANGALIESRLRFNQAALASLQAAARQTTFYGPDGTTRLSGGKGRDLGSA
jgi:flagellar biosynthesis protein FlgN